MNEHASVTSVSRAAELAVDERHPWLGLASFTEESRGYFYGREDEVGELSRRVQRKLLTILFGQSGLGKTSILQAGVVPRLREQGFCPVYVRIDYNPGAPEPAEQIKEGIFRAAEQQGKWSQSGVAVQGESLWEFLHHRDDSLRDGSGATLIPLLIFDQFEEIFTLAQSDEFGRQRATRFIEDLADLVENRPPKALEARFENDDTAFERFDFARSDYRVLIALREDYLAPLEGLKGAMPSITQNRMRLAPMTGVQALQAVTGPGGKLVSDEVAAAIVRFVAGGAELANAEVEPSLLSLICRELNDKRLAESRSEISLDMLDGSHAGILGDFYERALADQPQAVRRFIEDQLLTDSGFRENVAEERVLGEFAAAGAAPDALAVLVNRRLLRIEERLDIRRVELTHDVLCRFVKASRDQRQEREAREATERLLAEQRERELSARRALVRARQIASACLVLALIAVGTAIYGYFSTERAQRAETTAQETRASAEVARAQAEKLIAYLVDDLSLELDGVGRLGVVADLAQQEVNYYKSLPASLQTTDTIRNAAVALVRYGVALRGLGKTDEAGPALLEAQSTLERMQAGGDKSEATTIGLALALTGQAAVSDSQGTRDTALVQAQRAIEVMRPLMDAQEKSVETRRAFGRVANRLGFLQLRSNQSEKAVTTFELGKAALGPLVDQRPTDVAAAADYAQISGWEIDALRQLDRRDEARRTSSDGIAVAGKLLAERPVHMAALRARALIYSGLSLLDMDEMKPGEILESTPLEEADWRMIVRLDPGNVVAVHNLGSARMMGGFAHVLQGQDATAVTQLRAAIAGYDVPASNNQMLVAATMFAESWLALIQAERGDVVEFRAARARFDRIADQVRKSQATPGEIESRLCVDENRFGAGILLGGDGVGALEYAREAIARRKSIAPAGPVDQSLTNECLVALMDVMGQAQYQLRDFAAAAGTFNDAIVLRNTWPVETNFERRAHADMNTYLAMSLAQQGKTADALRIASRVVDLERSLASQNHGDMLQRMEFAGSLYALALADPAHREASLREASAIIAALPAEYRSTRSVMQWHERIAEAQSAKPG